jgi:HEPN superfamily AbiU2-like protein
MGIEEKSRVWRSWIVRIYNDASYLVVSKRTYERTGEIVRGNPAIQSPGHFHDWLSRNYGLASASGVRRLTDTRSDSVSLKRLLQEMSSNTHLLSRKSFVALYQPSMRQLGERDFDRMTGGKGNAYFPKALIDNDLRQLDRAVKCIRRFVDTRLAHLDQKNKFRKLPMFNDVFAAVDLIDVLSKKYYFVLKAIEIPDPIIERDWINIFKKPWIAHLLSNPPLEPTAS